MTLQDLYNQIEGQLRMCPRKGEDTVCIRVFGGTFGGQPVQNVKSAGCGFDWDNGKFIIYPEKELYKEDVNVN
jgi:hypothetical protein